MTAGIFARVPRLAALVVVALLLASGGADARRDLDRSRRCARRLRSPLRAAAAGRPRRSPPGLRVRQGRARAVRLRLEASKARFGATPRTSSPPRRPRPAPELVANGRAHDLPPLCAQLRLRAGRHARERLAVRGPPGPPARSHAEPAPSRRRSRKPAAAGRSRRSPSRRGRRCREAAEARQDGAGADAQAGVRRARCAEGAARRDHARRAREAARRLGSTRTRAHTAAVNHWLYQHNWIVTGAGFGWSHGAEALQHARSRRRAGAEALGRRRPTARAVARARSRRSKRRRGDARRPVAQLPAPAKAASRCVELAHAHDDLADCHGRRHRLARLRHERRARHEQPLSRRRTRRGSGSTAAPRGPLRDLRRHRLGGASTRSGPR